MFDLQLEEPFFVGMCVCERERGIGGERGRESNETSTRN